MLGPHGVSNTTCGLKGAGHRTAGPHQTKAGHPGTSKNQGWPTNTEEVTGMFAIGIVAAAVAMILAAWLLANEQVPS